MIEYQPKQLECLRALTIDSGKEIVLFGGAAGGSKSFTGCAWQIQRRLKYPGTRGVIGRSELKNLKLTTLYTFFEVCKMMGLTAGRAYTFNGQSNVITFYNGSEIILKDLFSYPSDPNFDSLGSLEITDWFIDEASQVEKKAISILRSRVRYKLTEFGLPPIGLMTCNPTKGWLYDDFYYPWKEGKLPEHSAFIPALPGDNKYLPDSYMQTLDLLPEEDRKRLKEGDWEFDASKDRIFEYAALLRMFATVLPSGKKYTTADIGAMGDDPSLIGVWDGMTLTHIYEFRKKLPHEIASEIRIINESHGVLMANTIVDADGLGIGVWGILKCRQFLNGSSAKDKARYENLRSECYYKLSEYVREEKIAITVEDMRTPICKELDCIRRKNMNSEQRLGIIPREQIIKLLGHSPDIASMIMQRFFFELNPGYGIYTVAGV